MIFQTIFIYTSILFTMMILGYIAAIRDHSMSINRKNIPKFLRFEIFLSLLIFSIIFGMRYDVGEDHLHYLNDYLSLSMDRYEPLFKNIAITLRENYIRFSIFFSILAFIQIFLLYYTFKDEKKLYPFLTFVLFTGQYFMSWMNIIRQDIVSCIFLFSTIFIFKRKIILYLFCCILAIGFHYSAILLIPCYWILYVNKDFLKSRFLQYVVILFCGYIALTKLDYTEAIIPLMDFFLSSSNIYSSYSIHSIEYFANLTNAGGGVSIVCQILIDLIIISYSLKLKDEFVNSRFTIFYNLYFFGTSINTLFINNLLFSRPFRCFKIFKLVVSAYLLFYLCTHLNLKNICFLIILLLLHIILYAAQMKNVQFLFYWQT